MELGFCHLLLVAISLSASVLCQQQCSYVTVPVCGEEATITPGQVGASKGAKGDQGLPGESGPQGIPGRATKGEKGVKGEIGTVEQRILEKLTSKLKECERGLIPTSCRTAQNNGLQTLRGGEQAVCANGWTVFQKRFDGSQEFYLGWQEYKDGFGNMGGEFWLGLDKIHAMTFGKGCRLRVDLWDLQQNHAFAVYSFFYVENEAQNYTLRIGSYSGNAGDSLRPHDGLQFTTKDRDNDISPSDNCAHRHLGAWWYRKCFSASLNARGWRKTYIDSWNNIIWYGWKQKAPILATEMKFRCD